MAERWADRSEAEAAQQWLKSSRSVHALRQHVPSVLRSAEAELARPGSLQCAPAALASRIRSALADARASVASDPNATIVAVGRSGAGKSALLNRVLQDCLPSGHLSTSSPHASDHRWLEAAPSTPEEADVPSLPASDFNPSDWTSSDCIRRLRPPGARAHALAEQQHCCRKRPCRCSDWCSQCNTHIDPVEARIAHKARAHIDSNFYSGLHSENSGSMKSCGSFCTGEYGNHEGGNRTREAHTLSNGDSTCEGNAETAEYSPKAVDGDESDTTRPLPLLKRKREDDGRQNRNGLLMRPPSAFLLPEGDKLDMTSVGYSVRLGHKARARIVYCSVAKAARHLGFLRAARMSWNRLDRNDTEQPNFRHALQRALAMCGNSPYTNVLDLSIKECGSLHEDFIERLGCALVYEPSGTDADTLVAKLARFLEDETVGESSHWGLVERVEVEIPSNGDWAGLELVDSPGAGEGDTARTGHLQSALLRADAVLLVSDARPLDGDVVQTLRDSSFMANERPREQSVIVASICDKAIGREHARSLDGTLSKHHFRNDNEHSWRPSALEALNVFERRLYELRLREIADCAAEASDRFCDPDDAAMLHDCLIQVPLYPTWATDAPVEGMKCNVSRLVSSLESAFQQSDSFKRARGVVRARRALERSLEICTFAMSVVRSPDDKIYALQAELVDAKKYIGYEERMKRSTLRNNLHEQCMMAIDSELATFASAFREQLSNAKREHCCFEAALQRMHSVLEGEPSWLARPLQLAFKKQLASIGELMGGAEWPKCRSQLAYILAAPLLETVKENTSQSILSQSANAICKRLQAVSCTAPAVKAVESCNLSDSASALLQWSIEDVSTTETQNEVAEAIRQGCKRALEKLSTTVCERIEAELASCLAATRTAHYLDHPSLTRDDQRARVKWRLRWLCVQAGSIVSASLPECEAMAKQAAGEMAQAAVAKHMELLKRGAEHAAKTDAQDVRAIFASATPFEDAEVLQKHIDELQSFEDTNHTE